MSHLETAKTNQHIDPYENLWENSCFTFGATVHVVSCLCFVILHVYVSC